MAKVYFNEEKQTKEIFYTGNLVTSDSSVVLVTRRDIIDEPQNFSGVIICAKENYGREVGYSSDFWAKDCFKQFYGKVTLEND